MGFSRQEYWSGFPCPPPGNLPNPVIKPTSLCLLYRQVGSLPLAPPGNPMYMCVYVRIGVHVCVYVHVYMYKCVYMVYAYMHKYVYMCLYVVCVCICVWMYICVHMCVCICMSVFTISFDRSPNHGNTAARLPGWGSRDGMWTVAAVGLELHISVAELCGFLSLGGPWSWPFSPSCRFPGVEAGWTLIKLYLPSPLAGQAFLLLCRPDPRPRAHAGHIVTTLQFILHPSLPGPRPSWPDWIPSLLSEHTLSSLCSSSCSWQLYISLWLDYVFVMTSPFHQSLSSQEVRDPVNFSHLCHPITLPRVEAQKAFVRCGGCFDVWATVPVMKPSDCMSEPSLQAHTSFHDF